MSVDNDKNTFASFMKPKSDSASVDSGSKYIGGENKTQNDLDKAREEEESNKKKELEEAKKNSMALVNRYGKSDMMKLQARNLIMMLPFIVLAVFILLVLFFKGGDWLSKGINMFFNAVISGK